MASVPPHRPLWVAQQAWPIYLYQGQGGGSGRSGGTGAGEEERLHRQVLLHMPGGMAGASHRGILLKVRQTDLPVTSAWGRYWACKPCVSVCEESKRRGSLWVYMKVFECTVQYVPMCLCVWSYRYVLVHVYCMHLCSVWCLCVRNNICIHVWWSVYALTPMRIICVSACQAVRWTGPSDLPLHPSIPQQSHKHARWRGLD